MIDGTGARWSALEDGSHLLGRRHRVWCNIHVGTGVSGGDAAVFPCRKPEIEPQEVCVPA